MAHLRDPENPPWMNCCADGVPELTCSRNSVRPPAGSFVARIQSSYRQRIHPPPATTVSVQLVAAYAVGILGYVTGLTLSAIFDLPGGAQVTCLKCSSSVTLEVVRAHWFAEIAPVAAGAEIVRQPCLAHHLLEARIGAPAGARIRLQPKRPGTPMQVDDCPAATPSSPDPDHPGRPPRRHQDIEAKPGCWPDLPSPCAARRAHHPGY